MTQIETVQGANDVGAELSFAEQASSKARLKRQRYNLLLLSGRNDQRSEILQLLKSKMGYNVLDGDVAPDQLREEQLRLLRPNAALIDVATLPHSRQLVTSLAELLPDAAIIILVGYGEYQLAQEYLMLGAHDFVTKPFSQERLSVTLRNALALQEARREVRDMLFMGKQGIAASQGLEEMNPVPDGYLLPLLCPSGEVRKLHEIESAAIRFAITFYNGRISTVSRKLGVGRSTLYRKLASYDRL